MRMMKAGLFVALMAGASPAISETTIVFNNFLAPNDSLWTDVMKPWNSPSPIRHWPRRPNSSTRCSKA